MQDSEPHKQRRDARRGPLQERLRHAENRQPQTEARLCSIFRAAPIGIGLVSNRVLLEVNDRLCEMVGYSREELVGCEARTLYPSNEDYDSVGTEKHRQIQEHGTGTVETRWRRKDGAIIDVLLSSAALDLNDLSQGITFTALDITHRKKTEKIMEDSEARYRAVVEDQTEFICRFRPDGCITFANEASCRFYGQSREDLIGRNFAAWMTPEEYSHLWRRLEALTPEHPVETHENRGTLPEGRQFWDQWTNRALFDEHGRVIEYQAIGRDITTCKEAEEALCQERDRAQKYLDTAGVIFVVLDREGRVSLINKKGCEVLGYSEEEIVGRSWFDTFLPPEVREKVRNIFSRLMQGKLDAVESGENVVLTKAREERVIAWHNTVLRNEAGKIVGTLSSGEDITECKRAEAERTRLTAIIEATSDLVSTSMVDGQINYINRAGRHMLGWSEGEGTLAKSISDVHPDWAFQRVTDEGIPQAIRNGVWEGETAVLGSDGREIPVSQVIMSHKTQDGTLEYISTIMRNLTERKRTETALRESETRFRELAELLPQTVFEMDAAGRFTFANHAGLESLGYTRKELKGLGVLELFAPKDRDRIAQNIRKRLNNEPVANREYLALRKDGSTFPVLLYASPILHDDTPVGLRGIGLDITERKQAEKERQARLHSLESMERINRIIRKATDPEQMLRDVIETVHSIFDSDRAWLLYPCDPEAPSFRVPVECSRPEYPGAHALELEVPMTPGKVQDMRDALACEDPLSYTAGTDHPVAPETAAQFGVQSRLITAVYPKVGKPWIFGLHQCSYPRVWTDEEQLLFKEIGHRIADGLSSLLSLRDLKESETRFRDLAELLPQTVFEMDGEGRFTFVSRLASETFGYDLDELSRLSAADMFIPEEREHIRQNLRRKLQDEPFWDHEYTALKKDGTTFPALVYSTPIIRDGKAMGLRGILVDITERQYAEQALQESKAKLESIFESSPNAICVTNLEGNIVDCNQATLDMHGFAGKDELLGRSTYDLVAENDRAKAQENIKKTSDQGLTKDVELTLLRKDGREFRSEVSVSLMRDRAGHPMGLVAAMADITERKQAEKSLRQSERKYRELYESSRDASVSVTVDGLILDYNSVFLDMLGYSPEEIGGLTYMDVTPLRWHQGEAKIIKEQVLTRGYSDIYEKEYRRKDGTVFPVELRAYLNRGEDGAPIGMWAFVRDITERKAAEQKLRAYQKKLKSLASELSLAEERERRRMAVGLHDHACQNLVLSKMKLQGLCASLPADQSQALEAVCQTLNKTIESIRELTFDLSSPILYKFGLVAALEELLKNKLWGEHHMHYRFTDDDQPKPLSQDVLVLLFQSVRELLINAIKHARAHEVVLDIRREHDSIRIVLADDGVGFDVSEVLSFPSEKRSVGLFNILERLDYIGGKLDVESEPGRGSRFTLIAPLTTEVPAAKEPHDGTENSAR